MKIVITGAAGFIGSTLAKSLSSESLTLIDDLSHGSLENLDSLADQLIVKDCYHIGEILKESPDVILHFAGTSSLPECEAYPAKAYMNNVVTTVNVLEYVRTHKCKLIFSSTSAVYENNDDPILTEYLDVRPSLVYSNTKYASEKILKSFAINYGLDIIICRFFNVYGANQDYRRKSPPFTSYLKKCLMENSIATIYNLDDRILRDYIYVDDIVSILKKMIYTKEVYNGTIFNLTSELSYSTKDILNLLPDLKYIAGDPRNFWSKYPELRNLRKDAIEHEVFKSSTGSSEKTVNEFFGGHYEFIPLEDGLDRIMKF